MATKNGVQVDNNGGMLTWTWAAMANADVGLGVSTAKCQGLAYQVLGTLGVAGSVQLEGSNDGGTTWALLKDINGTSTALTALGMVEIGIRPLMIRPHVTAGDGTTSLTVILAATRQ